MSKKYIIFATDLKTPQNYNKYFKQPNKKTIMKKRYIYQVNLVKPNRHILPSTDFFSSASKAVKYKDDMSLNLPKGYNLTIIRYKLK